MSFIDSSKLIFEIYLPFRQTGLWFGFLFFGLYRQTLFNLYHMGYGDHPGTLLFWADFRANTFNRNSGIYQVISKWSVKFLSVLYKCILAWV
jgi:hypothetical protein